MFGLVVNALRARRAQTVAMFILTVLAALGAGAAPWFATWAYRAVANSDIATAPAAQRVVTVTGFIRPAPGVSPSALLAPQVAQRLPVNGAQATTSARFYGTERQPSQTRTIPTNIGYRDDVCANVRITGLKTHLVGTKVYVQVTTNRQVAGWGEIRRG